MCVLKNLQRAVIPGERSEVKGTQGPGTFAMLQNLRASLFFGIADVSLTGSP
jgi:hypothetical protein